MQSTLPASYVPQIYSNDVQYLRKLRSLHPMLPGHSHRHIIAILPASLLEHYDHGITRGTALAQARRRDVNDPLTLVGSGAWALERTMAREMAAGLTNDESSRGAIGAPLILREHVVRRIPLFNKMRRNIRTALDIALGNTRRWSGALCLGRTSDHCVGRVLFEQCLQLAVGTACPLSRTQPSRRLPVLLGRHLRRRTQLYQNCIFLYRSTTYYD